MFRLNPKRSLGNKVVTSSAAPSPTYAFLPSSVFVSDFAVARYAFSGAQSYLSGISTQFGEA